RRLLLAFRPLHRFRFAGTLLLALDVPLGARGAGVLVVLPAFGDAGRAALAVQAALETRGPRLVLSLRHEPLCSLRIAVSFGVTECPSAPPSTSRPMRAHAAAGCAGRARSSGWDAATRSSASRPSCATAPWKAFTCSTSAAGPRTCWAISGSAPSPPPTTPASRPSPGSCARRGGDVIRAARL